MELYPSIGTIPVNTPIIAFDKLDGSNIRAEWTRKNGFAKFGTRRRLLDANEQPLGEAIPLFMETQAEELDKIFRKQKFEKATAFFEFYGENSFAGFHETEPHQVTLFDVHVYKQGILEPRTFLKLFEGKVNIPEVVYEGKPNQQFIEQVRASTLPGVTFEGVVCKGGLDNRRRVITFKVKSEAWLEKLKLKYVNQPEMFEKLK